MYGASMDSRKSVSPSALRKGHVYCVWSFARCAERWFTEEIARNSNSQDLGSVSRRRQPSRAAKDKFKNVDYTLITTMLDPAITTAIASSIVDVKSVFGSKNSTEQGIKSPDVALTHFRTLLSRLIWTKSEPWERIMSTSVLTFSQPHYRLG
ncbi:hypothetical protein F5883DRAFT_239715 [Diaporthe sp. PMI_573]|nr:hypothetical protein F5883DRAFT_239715 [Diaporthaceae sp. PMI_573]